MATKPESLHIKVQPELKRAVDEWRRNEPDLPGRAEAVRRLIAAGLRAGKPLLKIDQAEREETGR